MNLKSVLRPVDHKVREATGLQAKENTDAPKYLHPPERQTLSRRSGVVFVEVLSGSAALASVFLILAGLAERPSASRIAVELTLMTPLIFLIVWSIIKRCGSRATGYEDVDHAPH